MILKLFAKKILFWKLVFPWVDMALLWPMENIVWDDVVFKPRKTRQKLALSLTPLGAVHAAAEGTGYKNRRLGKSRGVRFDSRLVLSVRYDTLWAWNGRSVFLLALLWEHSRCLSSASIVVGAVTVTPVENGFVSPLSESSLFPRKH